MSFNKYYLPEIEELKKQYIEMGHSIFMDRINKRDVLIGSTESQEFIEELIKKQNSQCITSQKLNLKR